MPTVPIGPVAPSRAEGFLHRCLGEQGRLIPGRHFREELANEALTLLDAVQVLKTGCIFNPPEQDIKTGEWKYRIEGHTADGIWLCIVFSFKQVNEAFLITAFSVAAKRRTT